jgi:hypothetical protein
VESDDKVSVAMRDKDTCSEESGEDGNVDKGGSKPPLRPQVC